MSKLSTDAIVTIVSTVPGLLISSLSAWFAYIAIRRRHIARNDIETSTIGFVMMRLDPTSLSASFTASQPLPAPPPRHQLEGANSPAVPEQQQIEHHDEVLR